MHRDINDILNNTNKCGYILEVDLDYPEDIHDLHNDYPPALERLMLNKVEKLVNNLNNKKNYVLKYENLIQ